MNYKYKATTTWGEILFSNNFASLYRGMIQEARISTYHNKENYFGTIKSRDSGHYYTITGTASIEYITVSRADDHIAEAWVIWTK